MTRQESTVLLREARQGSPDALGELYARYSGWLLAFIRMKMGRDLRARVESRDILQATLLKSFQRLAQYRQASDSLDGPAGHAHDGAVPASTSLPVFEGFRTIERIGMGGMGDVYKLHDLKPSNIMLDGELRPSERYQSARDMALDLDRFLDGRPVTTRPSRYGSVLTARIRPHLDQIEDWLRLELIHPHEASRMHSAYRQLEKRDDDWISESRVLSYSQIALYLGAFLLMCGSLFYFWARRIELDMKGVVEPFIVLAMLGLLLALAVLSDFGLRSWVDGEQWDLLALHLLPLVPIYAAAGFSLERAERPWFGRPLYTGAAGSLRHAMGRTRG
jgi:hypothetical protein